ncbi:DNA polymerase [bacterium]|nr:DNA polymerase [bacterium]
MKTELKDWLNSINHEKENIMIDENQKEYPPYIINRCLSAFIDTIMFANEMNINHHLSSKLQYQFLLNIVRPKRRFSPWLKKEKLDDIEVVKSYYGYSNEKAKTALNILSEEQLNSIKLKQIRGGRQ